MNKINNEEMQLQIQNKLIEELAACKSRFRTMVDSLNEIMFSLDREGRIIFANKAFENHLGYDTNEVIGQPFKKFLSQDDQINPLLNPVTSPFSYHQGLVRQECRLIHRSGVETWFALSAKLSADQKLDCLAIDITAWIENERLKNLDADRMASISYLDRYVPNSLLDQVKAGKLIKETPHQEQTVTIMFTDLHNFTKNTGILGAGVISLLLNEYLTIMTEIIADHKGTIDKFIGDAIMVVFGSTSWMPIAEQAVRATECALAMQKAMSNIAKSWQDAGMTESSMRIGIHQGDAIVGNFGSRHRSDFTCIGAAVNMAARIERVCPPGQTFVSETIHQLLPDDFSRSSAGEYALRGIDQPAELYTLD